MKFKVGDRIAVYHEGKRYVVGVYGIEGDETIKAFINNRHTYFHPKQCRHLKKKVRRRIWIKVSRDSMTGISFSYEINSNVTVRTQPPTVAVETWAEFVEVKKK